MASTLTTVRVLEESQISPPSDTSSGGSLALNFFDFIFMCEPPVRCVFFYPFPRPTADFIVSVLPALKSSLSATLRDFYPLAGRTRPSPESSAHKLEIRYEDGDSVPFTVVEHVNAEFEDVSSGHDRRRSKLQTLISYLPKHQYDDMPLLAVQVTVFPNKGFAVTVGISHVACDWRSFLHFVRSWACACSAAGASVEPRPSFDRSMILFPESMSDPDVIKRFLETGPRAPPAQDVDVDVVLATFHVSKADIVRLKQRVSAKLGDCSGFTVTCAHAWVSLVKARAYDSHDKRVVLNFTADCRALLIPPAGPAYLGNCVKPCFADALVGELTAEDGVFIACDRIRKAIKQLEAGVHEGWERLAMLATAEKPMSVNGSPKFGSYDADFGWGKPVKVEYLSVRTGSISLTDHREEQGGIQLGIALVEGEMVKFRSYFSINACS